MLGYKHVLLATDLSKTSDKVAERAKEIAKKSEAALSVIHVIEHSPVAYGGEFSIPIDINLEVEIENQAREQLASLSSKFNIPEKNQHLESGSVKLAVLDCAKEVNADLIIVGTHGHHGFDVLLGSRANAILHQAQCDVLVVRIRHPK